MAHRSIYYCSLSLFALLCSWWQYLRREWWRYVSLNVDIFELVLKFNVANIVFTNHSFFVMVHNIIKILESLLYHLPLNLLFSNFRWSSSWKHRLVTTSLAHTIVFIHYYLVHLTLLASSIQFMFTVFVVADDVNEDILNVSITCFGLLYHC